jgi:hypothetical protein
VEGEAFVELETCTQPTAPTTITAPDEDGEHEMEGAIGNHASHGMEGEPIPAASPRPLPSRCSPAPADRRERPSRALRSPLRLFRPSSPPEGALSPLRLGGRARPPRSPSGIEPWETHIYDPSFGSLPFQTLRTRRPGALP